MTNSRIKKAIDETISEESLMNEAFVQKVMHGKKRRKKPILFLQPVLVALLMLAIGGVLYFIPEEREQALEVDSLYLAKPEHLQEISLQNRNNSQYIYVFSYGTLSYLGNTLPYYYEKPKSVQGELYSSKIIESQPIDIQIKTKKNQYFITGDGGFSWTLTRIAPRILVDENGIEYTIPYAFENIPQISDILLEDEIRTLGMYKIGGIGTYAYIQEENLAEVNELFNKATVYKEYTYLGMPRYMINIEYENGDKLRLELSLNERGKTSFVLKNDMVNNTVTTFKIPPALTNQFHQLAEKIEEIDNAK